MNQTELAFQEAQNRISILCAKRLFAELEQQQLLSRPQSKAALELVVETCPVNKRFLVGIGDTLYT